MTPRSTRRDNDDEDDEPRKKGRGRDDDEDDDDDEPPARKSKSRSRNDDDDEPRGGSRSKSRGRDNDDDDLVSLEVEDAVDVGLFDAGKATVAESIFADYDYGGSRKPVSTWLITFERDGEKYEQPYGIGKGWRIVNDGRGLKSKGGTKGLPKSCNAMQFLLKPLREAGMERGVFKGDPTVLEGLACVVDRVEQPKRPGLNQSDKDRTILSITKILSAPWDKASGGGKNRKPADDDDEAEADEAPKKKRGRAAEADEEPKARKGRAKPVDDSDDADDSLDEDAVEALIEALDTNKGKLALDDIEDALLVVLKGNKQAKAIAARGAEDDLLEQEKGWTFNAKKKLVTLA